MIQASLWILSLVIEHSHESSRQSYGRSYEVHAMTGSGVWRGSVAGLRGQDLLGQQNKLERQRHTGVLT